VKHPRLVYNPIPNHPPQRVHHVHTQLPPQTTPNLTQPRSNPINTIIPILSPRTSPLSSSRSTASSPSSPSPPPPAPRRSSPRRPAPRSARSTRPTRTPALLTPTAGSAGAARGSLKRPQSGSKGASCIRTSWRASTGSTTAACTRCGRFWGRGGGLGVGQGAVGFVDDSLCDVAAVGLRLTSRCVLKPRANPKLPSLLRFSQLPNPLWPQLKTPHIFQPPPPPTIPCAPTPPPTTRTTAPPKQHENVILADEMGLGKTIQSTAFLSALHEVRPWCFGVGRLGMLLVGVGLSPCTQHDSLIKT
jgi:hypothetical protein